MVLTTHVVLGLSFVVIGYCLRAEVVPLVRMGRSFFAIEVFDAVAQDVELH